MPAFPLHGWMPDGYTAMPIEVLMVFSGVLSKVGAYGFLAIVLPLFPHAAAHFQTLMLLIALLSILYGSAAGVQPDRRAPDRRVLLRRPARVHHAGDLRAEPAGRAGALLQMVNHGLVVAPLLFIVALLAQRAGGSEDIRDMGGIAFRAPVLASLFLIVSLATLAMPGSSNFVGEFLILLGVFKAKLVIAIIGFSGVVLASVYALRLFIRSMHNRVGPRVQLASTSSHWTGSCWCRSSRVIVFLALYPQLALHRSEGSVKTAVAPAQIALHPPPATLAARLPSAAGESTKARPDRRRTGHRRIRRRND